MVWKGLVGLRVHSERRDIRGQADHSGAVSGAVRNAAGYPFRPLWGAAGSGQHSGRWPAQPGQCCPRTGACRSEFPPPAFRGPNDESAFLRIELGVGIVLECLGCSNP